MNKIKLINASIANTLMEHSIIWLQTLVILQHNTSLMGSMKGLNILSKFFSILNLVLMNTIQLTNYHLFTSYIRDRIILSNSLYLCSNSRNYFPLPFLINKGKC